MLDPCKVRIKFPEDRQQRVNVNLHLPKMEPGIASRTFSHDQEHAMAVLDDVARSRKKKTAFTPGKLHVAKLLKLRKAHQKNSERSELICTAKPASKTSCVRWVHFLFFDHDAHIPKPELAEDQERIMLFFPKDQFERIQASLRSRKDQFCYFWQAADASQVKAWLFQPE